MPEPMNPQEKRKYWGFILIVVGFLSVGFGGPTVAEAIKHAAGSMMIFIGGIALVMSSRK